MIIGKAILGQNGSLSLIQPHKHMQTSFHNPFFNFLKVNFINTRMKQVFADICSVYIDI